MKKRQHIAHHFIEDNEIIAKAKSGSFKLIHDANEFDAIVTPGSCVIITYKVEVLLAYRHMLILKKFEHLDMPLYNALVTNLVYGFDAKRIFKCAHEVHLLQH